MTVEEKSKIMLKNLEKYLQINYNFENVYLKAITEGLIEIERRNSHENETMPEMQI